MSRQASSLIDEVVSYLRDAGIEDEADIATVRNSIPLQRAVADIHQIDDHYARLKSSGELEGSIAQGEVDSALRNIGPIFTKANFDVIKTDIEPDSLVGALSALHAEGILTDDNRDAVKRNIPLRSAVRALSQTLLFGSGSPEKGMLNHENFNRLKVHPNPSNHAEVLIILNRVGITTPDNINAANNQRNPRESRDVANALVTLKLSDILTPENRKAISQDLRLINAVLPGFERGDWEEASSNPSLYDAGILTKQYFDLVKNHEDPRLCVNTLVKLKKLGKLNEETFNAIKDRPAIVSEIIRLSDDALIEFLNSLISNGLSTQLSNFPDRDDISSIKKRLNELESSKSTEKIDEIRQDLLKIFSDESSSTILSRSGTLSLKNAAHHIMLALAEMHPKNDVDPISFEPIRPENKVVISSGHQFDILTLFEFHENRGNRNTRQVSDMGPQGKRLLDPLTNLPFLPDDEAHIREVAAKHSGVIELQRAAEQKRLMIAKIRAAAAHSAARQRPTIHDEITRLLRAANVVNEANIDFDLEVGVLRYAIFWLQASGILNQPNFDAVCDSVPLQQILKTMSRPDNFNPGIRLTQADFDAIQASESLRHTIAILADARMLRKERFDAICASEPLRVAVESLHNAGRLHDTSFIAIKSLCDVGILEPSILNAVCAASENIQRAIGFLHMPDTNILNQSNLDSLLASDSLSRALIPLKLANILNQVNFDAVRSSPLFQEAMKCMPRSGREYNDTHCLSQENFDSIISSERRQRAIIQLQNFGLISDHSHNVEVVARHSNPALLIDVLDALQTACILKKVDDDYYRDPISRMAPSLEQMNIAMNNAVNFSVVSKSDPLQRAIVALHDAGILDRQNFNAMSFHKDPESLFPGRVEQINYEAVHTFEPLHRAVALLHDANIILNQTNFDLIKAHQNLEMLLSALHTLKEANILTQPNFEAVIRDPNPQLIVQRLKESAVVHSPHVVQSMFAPAAESASNNPKNLIIAGLKEISQKYTGPHKSNLEDLIKRCHQCNTTSDLKKEIDKLTGFGGGLGNGKLNAALCELSREISHGESIDNDFLGKLAVDKNATKSQGPTRS